MILVTGGAGYIGSHTVVELMAAGHELLILDNFSNSSPKVLERIEQISGKRPAGRLVPWAVTSFAAASGEPVSERRAPMIETEFGRAAQ